jgi:hypothetical protein
MAERALDKLLRSLEFKARPRGTGASASSSAPIQFVGMVLGKNQQNVEVKVKREVGALEGYDDRLQAIAVARLGKAEPAVVVQDLKTNKWHALETTAGFQTGPVSASSTQGLTVVGIPSLGDIRQWAGKVKGLMTR